jgi:hypothetical protein
MSLFNMSSPCTTAEICDINVGHMLYEPHSSFQGHDGLMSGMRLSMPTPPVKLTCAATEEEWLTSVYGVTDPTTFTLKDSSRRKLTVAIPEGSVLEKLKEIDAHNELAWNSDPENVAAKEVSDAVHVDKKKKRKLQVVTAFMPMLTQTESTNSYLLNMGMHLASDKADLCTMFESTASKPCRVFAITPSSEGEATSTELYLPEIMGPLLRAAKVCVKLHPITGIWSRNGVAKCTPHAAEVLLYMDEERRSSSSAVISDLPSFTLTGINCSAVDATRV